VGATAGGASADRSGNGGQQDNQGGSSRGRARASLAEELVTVPGHGHPPIRHVRTRSLLDELDWRLDIGPGLTAAAERKFLDAIRDARRELMVDALDYRVVRP
jgi:hypothetical protein